jgi:enoyl-CoA hydratase/carnithine racemase
MTDILLDNDRIKLNKDENGIAHLIMVRADKRNAVDISMREALLEAGKVLAETEGLQCVVLSGEGKAFCAGIDLASIQGSSDDIDGFDIIERNYGNANSYQELALQYRKLPVPVIAAIHGVCFGAGMQIAGGADIRVATEDCRLAIRELFWGIVPDMGGFTLWRGIIRNDHLRELTYSARQVSGLEAQELGLVTQIASDPLEKAMEIANDIALKNPDAIRAAKQLFEMEFVSSTDEILMQESRLQDQLMGSPNQMEAVMSQMQKRKPNYS